MEAEIQTVRYYFHSVDYNGGRGGRERWGRGNEKVGFGLAVTPIVSVANQLNVTKNEPSNQFRNWGAPEKKMRNVMEGTSNL